MVNAIIAGLIVAGVFIAMDQTQTGGEATDSVISYMVDMKNQ
jgi:hypothetical protein